MRKAEMTDFDRIMLLVVLKVSEALEVAVDFKEVELTDFEQHQLNMACTSAAVVIKHIAINNLEKKNSTIH